MTIWRSFSSSTYICGSAPSNSLTSAHRSVFTSGSTVRTHCSSTGASATSPGCTSTRPASTFDRSRIALMSASRCCAARQDLLQVLVLLRRERLLRAAHDDAREADDRVERRAQLVRHVGEKLRLVPARDLELAALLLDLAEQARVLDRDRRLVGEGPEQRDLLVGERADVIAADEHRAEAAPFPQYRSEDDGLDADRPAAVPRLRRHPRRARRRESAPPAARGWRVRIPIRQWPDTERCARTPRGSAPWYAPMCSMPSSPTRFRPTMRPANRRWQLSRILSNTGAVSAIELLMR